MWTIVRCEASFMCRLETCGDRWSRGADRSGQVTVAGRRGRVARGRSQLQVAGAGRGGRSRC